MKFLNYFLLSVFILVVGTSCNAYFESKKKMDDKMLSSEEREFLSQQSASPVVGESTQKKNIGDIETDLHFLLCIPQLKMPGRAKVQKEEGSHGKISRMEVEIPPPYPREMFVELNILPQGRIDYMKYPVRVEGKIIRDKEVIKEFKTVITGFGSEVIPVPIENMYPLRFEVKLWDTEPVKEMSTLLYAQARLSLYTPETSLKAIYENNGDIKPIEETEVLSNPLRITLVRGN